MPEKVPAIDSVQGQRERLLAYMDSEDWRVRGLKTAERHRRQCTAHAQGQRGCWRMRTQRIEGSEDSKQQKDRGGSGQHTPRTREVLAEVDLKERRSRRVRTAERQTTRPKR